ncbi:MAG: F0F1 ATP synthase subunit A [Kiritimatiellae bacterium]|jgi:F-type H+-transporting ATPase subunit a|nr:F0F1 ATP synthase subunit A [Kiritimatiellia bacterium]
MQELSRKVIIEIPKVMGLDISITNEVILVWIAAAVTFLIFFIGSRRKNLVPKGFLSNFLEILIDMLDKQVIKENIGKEGKKWACFIMTTFFFILFANLLGMLPFPNHVKAPTSNINFTAAMAAIIFITTIYINISNNGVGGFIMKFIPKGIPAWITVLVFPIEVISWLAKPFSLAIRLFANMMAGHTLIFIMLGLVMAIPVFLKPLPLAGAVLMNCFELFVCFIQAFIFAMLSSIYIKDALEERH